jgi:hypothetical protein
LCLGTFLNAKFGMINPSARHRCYDERLDRLRFTSVGLPFVGREFAMITSNMAAAPPEVEQKTPTVAACGPMMQQGDMGGYGYEMHLQGFLRLIGCHQAGRPKEEGAERLPS